MSAEFFQRLAECAAEATDHSLFAGCLSISPIAAVNSALPPAPGLHAILAREFEFNAMHGQLWRVSTLSAA